MELTPDLRAIASTTLIKCKCQMTDLDFKIRSKDNQMKGKKWQ
jgi:hypothetical protein